MTPLRLTGFTDRDQFRMMHGMPAVPRVHVVQPMLSPQSAVADARTAVRELRKS